MLADIQETSRRLDKKYGKLLQHLNSLSDDVLYFKAAADKWSIVEVIEHLVVVEENMLAQLTGATSTTPLDPQDRSAKKYHIVTPSPVRWTWLKPWVLSMCTSTITCGTSIELLQPAVRMGSYKDI